MKHTDKDILGLIAKTKKALWLRIPHLDPDGDESHRLAKVWLIVNDAEYEMNKSAD